MSKIPYCDKKACLKLPKYVAQSPKEKRHTCEDHLVETVEDLAGKEIFIVKVDYYKP